MTEILDDEARARLVARFGEDVGPWCDELPALVAKLAEQWGLTVVDAKPGNTGRTLICAGDDGAKKVLKLTPDRTIAESEAAALRAWDGCSRVAQVLATELADEAILLEGIDPGTQLLESGASVPWAEVGDLMTQIHSVTPPAGFSTLEDRVVFMYGLAERGLRGSVAEATLPLATLDRARRRALALATDGAGNSLVHGDLHPGNVLDGGPGRGAVAIDPRPSVGDPAFDLADWVTLPMSDGGTLEDGFDALAPHLPGFDAERVRAWCVALSPLFVIRPLQRGERTPFVEAMLSFCR
ncbi:aminoglycoside phosphotransferase family protein [Amycolatopsis regifaucium]|uniref:Aminoglycoside phosphotransferase n=1 Tax=Amycolatopsis regifaucium TaxID=546365 RepID=A0A154MVX3_9PSEU|nr:aminoglycoside phosphotransferase family protein [Amycolatopsis regifaucium]KZB88415.1 aminoglycoside phosphotransferase [Amycolatopsis regifaucium]OKA04458.1 aminoglycoside phosphotransferase [Amycolatopsis regifaucium]SFH49527.1 streptomycin 6-kinase [Amycolatopsis regifaucium]